VLNSGQKPLWSLRVAAGSFSASPHRNRHTDKNELFDIVDPLDRGISLGARENFRRRRIF